MSLPAEFARRVGLAGGQTAVLRVEGGELRLRPVEAPPATLHEHFAPYLQGKLMSSDEFIAERHEEARREEEKFAKRGA